MPWFKIYAGLGGGFGGSRYETTEEFENEEEAAKYAWELACQSFESYDGMYGLQSIQDIIDEEQCDEKEAEEIWREQREGWLDYYVKPATGPHDTDD